MAGIFCFANVMIVPPASEGCPDNYIYSIDATGLYINRNSCYTSVRNDKAGGVKTVKKYVKKMRNKTSNF